MSISYSLHFLLAGWSVLTGIALGFLYEFFRLLHQLHARAGWLIFFEDLLFSLCCTCALALLFFNLSFGRMRLYAFAGFAVGFSIWYFTFGALFRMALSRLYRALRPRWMRLSDRVRTQREEMRFCHKARAGFGVRKQWSQQVRRKVEDIAQS